MLQARSDKYDFCINSKVESYYVYENAEVQIHSHLEQQATFVQCLQVHGMLSDCFLMQHLVSDNFCLTETTTMYKSCEGYWNRQ